MLTEKQAWARVAEILKHHRDGGRFLGICLRITDLCRTQQISPRMRLLMHAKVKRETERLRREDYMFLWPMDESGYRKRIAFCKKYS